MHFHSFSRQHQNYDFSSNPGAAKKTHRLSVLLFSADAAWSDTRGNGQILFSRHPQPMR
jgi:hypothetical protein